MSIEDVFKTRNDLTVRLCASLAHFNRDVAMAIVTSHVSCKDLEEIVKHQERAHVPDRS